MLVSSALVGLTVGTLAPPSAALPILLAVLALAAAFDLRTGLIPNALTLAATAFALVAWLSPPLALGPPASALTAASTLALLRLGSTVWLGAPGFGWGDVKLAVPLGLVLGWSVLWALYLAVVLAALVAVSGLAMGRLTRRSLIPFAPFILGGTLLHIALPFGVVLDWVAALTL
ncbi:MAG: prepilin peptidase [Bacteroidota bacterium]